MAWTGLGWAWAAFTHEWLLPAPHTTVSWWGQLYKRGVATRVSSPDWWLLTLPIHPTYACV